ncbi:pyocin knob domain-containing protein [Lentilactobacillus parakefiri]|uniref:Uncharacterized protein n=1 Tax=Lentilactobacillus parakefiri TaxID=152332 RepID=A0A224VJT3_9LACO|nr:pyocin knob domain-containing protein [Lentilactobacillus parakefiri]KRL70660.1 hypothetical protein FD08_GL000991 [Lentilactobacillus parakefiri DSM 10551]PAK99449.1 hypothetical protein B8W96_11535 [Lentilactobacillus parakefiri]TDG88437.1 hypothetical protein C5L28_000432 [Lentilactobacillus parakefiri]GAW72772.1 hypothetical protein LPKJCM_01902 [Lentilactobacillus parakefiri]
MATPNVGILTNAGKNLIDRVNAGQTKITFSKIVFSSMNNNQLTDDKIKALTTVAPQEIVINNPEVTLDNNTGETRIRATGNNKALTDGVYVKTYAVYAKDDSGNEILYGITVSPNPNYLPEYDGVTPQAVTYSYKVNISNTSNITFTNSNDIYVSDTDLAEALQPYAKTVDVNQQLDKKVNVADMRKPASDVAGIEEVNAKQDKIGYTPADDSKVVHNSGNEEIGGQKTFDVAPIDSTTVNPYITKSDVPKVDLSSYATNSQLATKADDSKVVHKTGYEEISGTKVFDRPPTDKTGNSYVTTNYVTDAVNLAALNITVDIIHKTGYEEISGTKVFDVAPIDKTTGNPYITKDGVPSIPSDVARTGIINTFSSPQIFSQGIQTLQTVSYSDINLLVNEGLYFNTNSSVENGAGSITTGYVQVMSGYGGVVRQFMYSDVTNNLFYTRVSSDNRLSWSNWVQIITSDQLPSDIARTGKDTNFTGKLQQAGSDVITQANWVESDSDTHAQSSSKSDAEGFYYTEES